MIKRKRNNVRTALKGFSLAETALSVFIVSVGLVVIVNLMGSSLRSTFSGRDIVIASALAQEGVELVRNVRDSDMAAGGDGFNHFDNNVHCQVQWDNDPSSDITCHGAKSLSDYKLKLDAGTGTYVAAGASDGKYYRYVYVNRQNGAPNRIATVRSFVFWAGKVGSATINPADTFSDFGNTGSSSNCNLTHLCVFTETYLTSWKN